MMDTADFSSSETRSGTAQTGSTSLAQTINDLVAAGAPMVDIALAYARAGIPVFPVNHRDKAPLVPGGHHRATVDETLIREWWSQWPDAMPAIPMGPASGLWAGDVDRRDDPADPKKNLDGEAELRRIGFKVEEVACRVRSGSGRGLHLVFKLRPGAMPRTRAGDIARGVDVRGPAPLRDDGSNSDAHCAPGFEGYPNIVSGGFIIAAGAKNSQGGRYIFEHGDYTTAADAPRELLFLAVFNSRERRIIGADAELKGRLNDARPEDWLFVYADRQRQLGAFRRVRKQDAKAAGYTAPIGSISIYALRAFEAEVHEVRTATEGERNYKTFCAACSVFELVKAGALDKCEVSRALTEAALSTGLQNEEIQAALSSAWERVEPRDLSVVRSGQAKPKGRTSGASSSSRESSSNREESEPGNNKDGRNSEAGADPKGQRRRPNYPDVTEKGKIIEKSPANVRAYLTWRSAHAYRDTFACETYVEIKDGASRRFDDTVLRELWLENADFWHAPTKAFFEDVVEDQARLDQRHPVLTYLGGLKWDGTPRLDKWLTAYFGAADTPLNKVLGRKTLIAAVRRLRDPGVKFDQMLVLEGTQGAGKSRALRALAGDAWFSDNLEIGADTKRIMEITAGKWIIEIPELSGMNRRDVEHVKAMLSRQVDEARLSYDRKTTKAPRQFILIGTTNASAYLLDDTGGRRFWPVKVADSIDVAQLERDRDQLWAEAVVAEAAGEALYLPDELRSKAEDEQTARRISHPWKERLDTLLDGHSGVVLKDEIYAALGIESGRQNKTFAGEIANHMIQLGWKPCRLRHPDKGRPYAFRHGESDVWLEVTPEYDQGPPRRLVGASIKSSQTSSEGPHDPFSARRAA